MDLTGALELGDRELVSFVGAGGKKTSMKRLTEEGTGTYRVGYTTTTHMPPPESYGLIIADEDEIEREIGAEVTRKNPIAFAKSRVENPKRVDEKVTGFDSATIDTIYDAGPLDWILVKADGARMRELKAPGEVEPVIPSATTLVVPVVSAKVFGAKLTADRVHRPERVAAIAGIEVGGILTPDHVGTLLADTNGGLKQVPDDARVVPMVNKADRKEERRAAQQTLETAFERSDRLDRGLITSFHTNYVNRIET